MADRQPFLGFIFDVLESIAQGVTGTTRAAREAAKEARAAKEAAQRQQKGGGFDVIEGHGPETRNAHSLTAILRQGIFGKAGIPPSVPTPATTAAASSPATTAAASSPATMPAETYGFAGTEAEFPTPPSPRHQGWHVPMPEAPPIPHDLPASRKGPQFYDYSQPVIQAEAVNRPGTFSQMWQGGKAALFGTPGAAATGGAAAGAGAVAGEAGGTAAGAAAGTAIAPGIGTLIGAALGTLGGMLIGNIVGKIKEVIVGGAHEIKESVKQPGAEGFGWKSGALVGGVSPMAGMGIAAIAATKNLQHFSEAILDNSEGLRRFSGVLAVTFGKLERQQLILSARMAMATGGTASTLGKTTMELKAAFAPIDQSMQNVKNIIGIGLGKLATEVVKIVDMVTKPLQKVVEFCNWMMETDTKQELPIQHALRVMGGWDAVKPKHLKPGERD